MVWGGVLINLSSQWRDEWQWHRSRAQSHIRTRHGSGSAADVPGWQANPAGIQSARQKKKNDSERDLDWGEGGDNFFGLGSESIQGASSGGAMEAWQSADWKALVTSRSCGPVRQRTSDGGPSLARYRSFWELRSGIRALRSEHRSEDAHLPLRT